MILHVCKCIKTHNKNFKLFNIVNISLILFHRSMEQFLLEQYVLLIMTVKDNLASDILNQRMSIPMLHRDHWHHLQRRSFFHTDNFEGNVSKLKFCKYLFP